MLLFLLKKQFKRNVNFLILVYPIIFLSILTFFRGFESDDLSIKKYLSSAFSFYFFPLLLLIRVDSFVILKFLKSITFLIFLVNLFVLFTLSLWLESAFFTDQISRTLMSISGIIFFFLLPFNPKFKSVITASFIFSVVLNIFMARRAESFFFSGMFIYTLIEGFKFNPLKNSLYIIITISVLAFLVSNSDFGLTLLNRYNEGYENREFFIEEVLLSLSQNNSFVFGEGAQAKYYSYSQKSDRLIVEHGFYDMLLRSGLVSVILFSLLSIMAIYRGFFKSNNTFVRRLAVYILLYLALMFGHGVFEFSYRLFFLWVAISICLSNDFLNIRDSDISKSLS